MFNGNHDITIYNGNPKLKAANVSLQFTQEQIKEYVKCAQDPVYFIEHYIKVVSLDDGVVQMKLYPYQKRIIEAVHNNRKVIGMLFRQSGKSTVLAAYITWYYTFNSHKTSCILANKKAQAVEIFGRSQFMYEELPEWIKPGVVVYNKTSMEFDNGSVAFCAASSASAIRGRSINLLLCDEFAYLGTNLAEDFISSVFPTLSKSETSKLVLISTPNGLNHFYKIWKEAQNNTNGFVHVSGSYKEIHTDQWAEEQRKILGPIHFASEVLCEFSGSSNTLVKSAVLTTLPQTPPIKQSYFNRVNKDRNEYSLHYFKERIKDHIYAMTVDVSRGRGKDFSAFIVFDITTTPYEIVCTFKDNVISTMAYPTIIDKVSRYYDSPIVIENNDLGESVANDLWFNFENENVLWTNKQKISGSGILGVKTTRGLKNRGCSSIKEIIENKQLIINDIRILQELSVFVLGRKGTYEAQDVKINDDLCSCLWLFGWFVDTDYFKQISEADVNKVIIDQIKQEYMDDDVVPFGFVDNGGPGLNKISDINEVLNNTSLGWGSLTTEQQDFLKGF